MSDTLDQALETMHHEATRERTPEEQVEDRTRLLKGMRKPQLTLIATAFDPDVKGTIPTLIEFILDHEFPWRTGVTEEQIVEAHEKSVAEGLVPADAEATVPPAWEDEGDLTAQNGPEFADPEPQPEQTMIWIGDVSFRCQCGTNVFTKHGEHEFTCNGCGTRYDDGTRNDSEAPEPETEFVAQGGEILASDEEMEQFHEQVEERIEEVEQAVQQYEEGEVLRRRQQLFGFTADELEDLARDHGVATNVPRNFMIQAILDAEYKPRPGRGWAPNGAGTTGDPSTDRLRQMQYDADPAMRRNYERES